jgi:transposase-like protein
MENSIIIQRLNELELKLEKLIEQNQSLKDFGQSLYTENESLKGIISKQNEEIKNFQNQDKISKLVSSIAEGAQNSTELKLKINEYIKEIDKCIVFLSE